MYKFVWQFAPYLCTIMFLISGCGLWESFTATSDTASQSNYDNPETAQVVMIRDPENRSEIAVNVPQITPGKTNVVFLYSEPAEPDFSWTYSHELGRQYIQDKSENVQTTYIDSIPDSKEISPVIRAVAEQGFDIIFTTTDLMMEATADVAAEFPESTFINIGGFMTAPPNLGTFFVAMEEAKYLAGMVAGARAAQSAFRQVGIVAQFPTAEIIRSANAVALGMRRTCPDCIADIHWTFDWGFDTEVEATLALLENGASVIVNNSGAQAPVETIAERGLTIIVADSAGACMGFEEFCLGTTYWNWGPAYLDIVERVIAGTWEAGHQYDSIAENVVGFYGFMPNQRPLPGVPLDVIPEVQEVFRDMQRGRFTRFDIFRGPLKNNQGEIVISDIQPTQSDLEGLTADIIAELGITDREPCIYCMNFLVEGFAPEAIIPKSEEDLNTNPIAETGLSTDQEQVINFWTSDIQPERMAVYEDIALRYMRENPSVKIVIEPVAENDFFDRLQLAIALDEIPDVVRVGVERIPILGAEGILDQAAAERIIETIGIEDFHERTLEMVTDNSSHFYAAVPFDGWIQAIWYRKDIFDTLGLGPPESWDAIKQANQLLPGTDNLGYGITLGTDPRYNYAHQVFEQIAISAGAYPFDMEGRVTMNTPEMLMALKWYAQLQEHALTGPQYWRGARESYELDQTGMLIYSTYIMDDLVDGSALEEGGNVEIAVEDLAEKTGFVAQIFGPKGPATYGQLIALAITTEANAATEDVVTYYMTEGYQEIIGVAPFGKIPTRKSAFKEWRNSSEYFQYYSDEILQEIANGYNSMDRWLFQPHYDQIEQQVISDIENDLKLSAVLNQLVVERTLTAEQAVERLQSEVEELLERRKGLR